jgi:hypothetical protein
VKAALPAPNSNHASVMPSAACRSGPSSAGVPRSSGGTRGTDPCRARGRCACPAADASTRLPSASMEWNRRAQLNGLSMRMCASVGRRSATRAHPVDRDVGQLRHSTRS